MKNKEIKKTINLQTAFLNTLRTNEEKANIVLSDGTKLTGIITGFDLYTIILKTNYCEILIYKNNVAYINPENINFQINNKKKRSDCNGEKTL